LTRPGGEFIWVDLSGENGPLTLNWRMDVEASQQLMVLDNKLVLVTDDRALS
jgi:hypothetical protein